MLGYYLHSKADLYTDMEAGCEGDRCCSCSCSWAPWISLLSQLRGDQFIQLLFFMTKHLAVLISHSEGYPSNVVFYLYMFQDQYANLSDRTFKVKNEITWNLQIDIDDVDAVLLDDTSLISNNNDLGMNLQELRRKLPVTRTLFAWDKALQLSLTREIAREFSNKR
jgi:hypothetical protein